jgi:HSP20 family protein
MSFTDLIPWTRDRKRTLSPRESYDPFFQFQRQVNRLLDDTFRGFEPPTFASQGVGGGWPDIEAQETDKEVRITADLPGIDEKDVEIVFEDGILTIRGEKKAETEDRDRAFSERFYGRFERRVALGRDVDDTKAEAKFKNGVLTVVIPKSPEALQQARRIPITKGT